MTNEIAPILDASKYCDLRLHECGRERCIPNKQFKFTSKNYHLFHFVLSGKGTFGINGRQKILSRGAIFYIPPHCTANYSPVESDPWQYMWLGIDGQMADLLLSACGITSANPIFYDNDTILKPLLEQLWDRYGHVGKLDIVCLGLTYQIFGQMISVIGSNSRQLSPKQIYVNNAKEFITYNFQFDITIGDIANSVGINANYLSNIFKEIESVSPKKYLTQIRMERASALLKLGNQKIKEIGKAVGYSNQLHFSSEFKKVFGVSPQNYLINSKVGNDNE